MSQWVLVDSLMLYNECHFHVDFNVLYRHSAHSAHGFRIIFTYNYPFSKPFQNVNIEQKYIFFHCQIYTKVSTPINKTSHLTNVFLMTEMYFFFQYFSGNWKCLQTYSPNQKEFTCYRTLNLKLYICTFVKSNEWQSICSISEAKKKLNDLLSEN